MTSDDRSHGQDGNEILDLPIRGHEIGRSENDHADDADKREQHAPFEALQDFGDLDEEVGELGFFGRCAPGHVDLEHVSEQGRRDVQRQTAEEDGEHESPFEIEQD